MSLFDLKITSDRDHYFRAIGRINSVHLGVEDHGIFTFNLGFDFGSSHQGVGHLCLGSPSRNSWAKNGLKLLHEVQQITGPLLTCKGKTVLVLRGSDDWHAAIVGIQPLIGGEPLIFANVLGSEES